eukprot:CAMPEP_0115860994 /NCGR_PEP_ID=MMETSP0287-20121206/17421_1 /TAXON_ID=412157 /ORGANISM="Chrysochromulina rotalis, Strain UIO044" /LENGTH=39 /DNA_ID= /DNA_START= /DNA_END= /DNA_ORIENTATION=
MDDVQLHARRRILLPHVCHAADKGSDLLLERAKEVEAAV